MVLKVQPALRGNAHCQLLGMLHTASITHLYNGETAVVICGRGKLICHILRLSGTKHESAICCEAALRRLPCCQEKRPRLHCMQGESEGDEVPRGSRRSCRGCAAVSMPQMAV